jgi:hypothetical protein
MIHNRQFVKEPPEAGNMLLVMYTASSSTAMPGRSKEEEMFEFNVRPICSK